MKRTLEFTDHQTDTWVAVLSQFPVATVNRAVLQCGLDSDPFPDLGKLVMRCQAIESERQDQYAPGRDTSRASQSVVKKAAAALEMEI